MYEYKVKSVDSITDGDTIRVTVDLGFNLSLALRVRMHGYDTVELFKPTSPESKELAIKAKSLLSEYLSSCEDITIITRKDPAAYGRYDGTLWGVPAGKSKRIDLNAAIEAMMADNGLLKEPKNGK